ncbi:MAG: hypothetical protein WDN24_00655 [Sphingomonas sp.]
MKAALPGGTIFRWKSCQFWTVTIASSGSGKAKPGKRLGDRSDIGAARDGGLLLVRIGSAEGDELVRLKGIDMPLRAHRACQDRRPISARHQEIGNLVAGLDAREAEHFAGLARGVARGVCGGSARVGERGGDRGRNRLGVRGGRGGEREQRGGGG